MNPRPPILEALGAAVRLRCPNCGRGKLFRRWLRMFRRCPVCGLSYFREEGYYLGAMFLNFILSALLIIAIYLALLPLPFPSLTNVSTNRQVLLWILFGILLSLSLMRLSYSLWLSLDFWIAPWLPEHPSEIEREASEDSSSGVDSR